LAGEKCIVRLSQASARTPQMLLSEFAFMKAMKEQGLSAVEALPSRSLKLVETLSHKNSAAFHACVFTYAAGEPAKGFCANDPSFLTTWSFTSARLHKLAESYVAPIEVLERPHWHEDPLLLQSLTTIQADPNDKTELNQSIQQLQQLASLGLTKKQYGTVHADLHPGNFFVENDTLILFDFDDCCRHWYVYDLAVSVASLMQSRREKGTNDSAKLAINDFLEGYTRERVLESSEIRLLNAFIRFRLLLIRLWWKSRSEQSLATSALEAWGLAYDPWSRMVSAELKSF
jgi:amicoumacin kinase